MKKIKFIFITASIFIFILFQFLVANAQHTITSFTPLSGSVGTIVTINGTNFSTIDTNNVVYFGATKATIIASSINSLSVIVPLGATYQPISVTNLSNGLTAYSQQPFITTICQSLISNINYANKEDFITGKSSSFPLNTSIADLDGDGKSDLIIANGDSTISIFRNTSDSGIIAFDEKVDYITGMVTEKISIGDLDGDGKLDLIVPNGDNTISVFRNLSLPGNVSFDVKMNYISGSSRTTGISIGDLDEDGKPELVVANYDNGSGNTISIFKNTSTIGTISFAAKIDYITAIAPYSISICDLDSDRKPDIVVSTFNNSTIYAFDTILAFRNECTLGNISFAPKANIIPYTGDAYCISIGDMDGDGKLDIVIPNVNFYVINVYRNTSSIGTFSFILDFNAYSGNNSRNVSISDLNGDGKLDIVTTNSDDNSISIYKNTSTIGNIYFENKNDFSTGNFPFGLSIGDLDADSKSDLVVANMHSGTISVLKNKTETIYQTQQICVVTIDTITAKNKICWKKTPEVGIVSYLVYKEVMSGIYNLIGNVLNSSAPEFIDTSSTPELHNDKYKISIIDTCNSESQKSNFHQTIFLSILPGNQAYTIILNWNHYINQNGEYFPIFYKIYRGYSPNSMSLYATVGGMTTTYTDLEALDVYYYKIIVGGICDLSNTYSNTQTNLPFIGIKEINLNNMIFNYPNPMSTSTTITISNTKITNGELNIIDITGKIVRSIHNISGNKIEIERKELLAGIYFIELRDKKVYRGKLIVE